MKQSINQLKEQLGWQGTSGIILLLLAGAFLTLSLDPLEQETESLRNRLEIARSKSVSGGTASGTGDRQQELAAFFDSLPDEKSVTDVLASIYTVAGAAGVELKQAEYHLDDKSWPRVEYGMNFPMTGEYPRIRAFLSRVLADHPAMALDQVNFQRDRIGETSLKAEVKLTLFLNPVGRGYGQGL